MRRLIAFLAVGFALGCHTIQEDLPQRPTNPNPLPQPVVVVPVPIPSPQAPAPAPPPPDPAPAPAPSSTPPNTPAPAPPAPPSSQSCSLPSMPDNGNCTKESPQFLGQVESALDQVIREHPSYFDLRDGGPCGNCYKIVNMAGYEAAVTSALFQRGLCAVGGEEFGVKNTNSFNEQYDLSTSSGYIRRQAGSYQVTCRPAAF